MCQRLHQAGPDAVAAGRLSADLDGTSAGRCHGGAQGAGEATIPVCIDISHHQGFPHFKDVRAAGVLGIIHKATEGTTFVDPNRVENCASALAAGLAVSTYFWLKPGDGRSQAQFYLETIHAKRGERVCIDYEEEGCVVETLHDAIQALLDADLDLRITVYSGHLLKDELGHVCDSYLQDKTDLWLAEYRTESTIDDVSWASRTYPCWTLHQYSETGEVPGIDDSCVDFNRFNGSSDEFLTWIMPTGEEPPVRGPEPERTVVKIGITAPPDVKVEVTVNDTPLSRLGRLRRAARRGPDLIPGTVRI
ncbi:glycoside hydrolase family 25 protein (plasmid) [Bradyrhizobium barranii]|uniref:Glycoside hydrolase family 25 protein n=1 Tax=Bradyrhizobium barranii TaxID=2992140 RepID=A0ABY3R2H9_9BRAD|nr:glycoside hydrolase family 25 protein [Bradyrhizobium japonicum]UFW91989.1 glycoside hydrolase family 25 protein [Bradyrhizobium japonicum]